jgi:hypothetical protein
MKINQQKLILKSTSLLYEKKNKKKIAE